MIPNLRKTIKSRRNLHGLKNPLRVGRAFPRLFTGFAVGLPLVGVRGNPDHREWR
jgi:hypothetical protein